MTRMLAFVAALFMTAIAVSSACIASSISPLHFSIEPSRQADRLTVKFQRSNAERQNDWSTTFDESDLTGLDVAALRSPGSRPLRFAVSRDAGRIDCSGTGGSSRAEGSCTMTPSRAFNDFLAANRIARPSEQQTFVLIALNVRRELVGALSTARYPTPTPDKLVELTAVGVTPAYIRRLAGQGFRPRTLDELVQFGALRITPDYVGSFVRAGYRDLRPDELVQLKALNITPDFVAGFERVGYRNLPVSTLMQLKALDVTPEFVLAVSRGGALPSPDRLVQMRALGREFRKR